MSNHQNKRHKPDVRGGHFNRSKPYDNDYNNRSNNNNNNRNRGGGDEDQVPPEYLARVKSIGSSKEDIEQWRAERRRRFPRLSSSSISQVVNDIKSEINVKEESNSGQQNTGSFLGSQFAAYATDEEEEDDEIPSNEPAPSTVSKEDNITVSTEMTSMAATRNQGDNSSSKLDDVATAPSDESPLNHKQNNEQRVCSFFSKNGHCRYGNRRRNKHVNSNNDAVVVDEPKTRQQQQRQKMNDSKSTSSTTKLKTPKELMETLLKNVCLSSIYIQNWFCLNPIKGGLK